MRRRHWARGGRLALLLGSLTLLLTGCSVSRFENDMRFGWPAGVTKQAEKMRVMWTWSCITALIVGIIVWTLIFWCCFRYRRRSDALPRQTKYNLPIETVYSILPFLIIAGLFYFTVRTENYVNAETAKPNLTVQVNAFKWNWQFEYKSYQGKQTVYSGTTQSLNTVGSSNEIPVLVIPRGQTVRFIEHSEDVIHSFWVPEFLFKRDVIPFGTNDISRDNTFEITAIVNGHFVGRCAELCGTYHSQMNFEVRVVDPAKFQAYMAALTRIGPDDPARQYKALAAAGEQPCATTTHPFNTSRTARSASERTSCA